MAVSCILELIDESTNCILDTVGFEVPETSDLLDLLGTSDFLPNASYKIDSTQLESLSQRFGLSIVSARGCSGMIRLLNWLDDLPYAVHTNRELILMLAGTKPLAYFCEPYPNESPGIPESRFDQHVADKRFVKRSYIETRHNGRFMNILYSLPNEEWRIDAYILMLAAARVSGWNEGFERMEGLLLGYEEWQCDAYDAARSRRR